MWASLDAYNWESRRRWATRCCLAEVLFTHTRDVLDRPLGFSEQRVQDVRVDASGSTKD